MVGGSLILRTGKKLNRIIRLAIIGNAVAQEELCKLYAKPILFQSRILVKDKSDAEDVAQKVIIEMLRGISNLKSPYAFRSWLQRIISNASMKHNIQKAKEVERSDILEKADSVIDENETTRPEYVIENKELTQEMNGYLDRLPPTQAMVLVLYYYEEQSYKEIATTLGVSIGSISSTMSKAKKNLRKLLNNNASGSALGIIYSPVYIRKSLRRIVINEVESIASDEIVSRLLSVAKLTIAVTAVATGAVGIATAYPVIVGTGTAISALVKNIIIGTLSAAVVGGTVVAAVLLAPNEEVPATIEQNAPLTTTNADVSISVNPNVSVVYSINTEQDTDTTATSDSDDSQSSVVKNPLTSTIVSGSGERLVSWAITDEHDREIVTGTNDSINIAELNLSNGKYLITWNMLTQYDSDFFAYWEFLIDRS